jgi:small subunit ribosomal protein S14
MAKQSQINRNKKREKLVAQYAVRRAALKAQAEDEKLPQEERFAARLKLAKLPRNSSRSASIIAANSQAAPRAITARSR